LSHRIRLFHKFHDYKGKQPKCQQPLRMTPPFPPARRLIPTENAPSIASPRKLSPRNAALAPTF
jgi:hypothetical protein